MYDEPRANRAATFALLLAIATALTLAATGPLYRAERVSLTAAFAILRWAAYAGIASLLFAAVGAIVAARRGRGMATAVVALLIAGGSLALPLIYVRQAARAP